MVAGFYDQQENTTGTNFVSSSPSRSPDSSGIDDP